MDREIGFQRFFFRNNVQKLNGENNTIQLLLAE